MKSWILLIARRAFPNNFDDVLVIAEEANNTLFMT